MEENILIQTEVEYEKLMAILTPECDENISTLKEEEIAIKINAIARYKDICVRSDNGASNQLAKILKILTHDIYKDSLHFFLELIQNADDASKSSDSGNHNLSITITKSKDIIFEYDDRGFNFSDLMAITSLGNSTKKAQLNENADIGEKGIGFKSIFAIAERVNIQSKYFSFSIDSSNGLINILKPCNITLDRHEKTKLTLILHGDKKDSDDFFEKINEWIGCNITTIGVANPFLFLKNITSVSFENQLSDSEKETIKLEKETINDNFTKITIGANKYITYTENMEFDKDDILSRWQHLQIEVEDFEKDCKSKNERCLINRPAQICFPLHTDKVNGKIYSYLPTDIKLTNFPVFINLDVHLTASRGNITKEDFSTDSAWNNKVQNNLVDFLKNAYLAIVATNEEGNELRDNAELKEIREELYKYLSFSSSSSSMYSAEIKNFISEIKNEAIFLTNSDNFVKKDDVHPISKYSDIDLIYKFLENSKGLAPYPKTLAWNSFASSVICAKSYTIYDIITNQNGIKDYWVNYDETDENKKEIIAAVLRVCKKSDGWNTSDEYKMITIECDDAFEIVSYNDLKNPVFFHAYADDVEEDKDNSVFIYQDSENEFAFSKINVFYENIYGIKKYNLANFFDSEFDKIKAEEKTAEVINRFIDKTFEFFLNNKDCYGKGSEHRFIDTLKEWTLSVEDWGEFASDTICKDYLTALGNSNICKWTIKKEYNTPEYISSYRNYMIFLGLKCEIEVVNDTLDAYSLELMPKDEMKIECTNRSLILSPLQVYYFSIINKNINVLGTQKIKDFALNINTGTKELFMLEKEKINSINENFGSCEGLELEKSDFCVIAKEYENVWRKLKVTEFNKNPYNDSKSSNESKFMNSFNSTNSSSFLDELLVLNILNKVFNVKYVCGNDEKQEAKPLSVDQFCSCYKKLEEGEKKLSSLMEKGYTIINLPSIEKFFEDPGELSSFLITLDIEIDDFNIFSVINNDNFTDDYFKLSENCKNENIKYLVKKKSNKTDTLLIILKVIHNRSMPSHIKKEIQDFFGEIREGSSDVTLSQVQGHTVYCKGVAFEHHKHELEIQISSIYSKEILQKLCSPHMLKIGQAMEGYGYTCPICGSISNAGLNSMKFKRFRNNTSTQNPYLYITSCLNCNETLSCAKSIEIMNFDEIVEKFSYFYCTDNDHIKNNSEMMTVSLIVKRFDDKILSLPMKISYYTMLIHNQKRCCDINSKKQ